MKYTKILGSPIEDSEVRYLYLERACNACGHKLTGDEKFCPQCGHKLLCIKSKVPEDYILSILNGNAEPGNVLVEPTDDCASVEVRNTAKDIGECRKETKCLHGFNKDTCGHCTPNGACDMCICSCIPPRYQMCPFCGDGFIDCKDA